uniref:6,7-dimethyl-8-ribityllumazine synthase n=1 Tax=Acidobacterium capsulatum TaxID=33075 RepID=A0A7V5CTC4_9BACT
MIKGITVTRHLGSEAHFERLAGFFSALGFEPGKGWHDATSRGSAFLAPLGNLELIHPLTPAGRHDDIYIEVTSLDSVRQVAEAWLLADASQPNAAAGSDVQLSEVTETDWGARLFRVSPTADFSFTFWEFSDPHKGKPVALEGDLSAEGMRFAIVVARWNAVITDRLLQGSLDALYRSGAKRSDVEIVRVPGAWEIPSAARKLAESGKFHAIVTLGVLLRGETAHYEAIYNEVSRGIGQSQQETGIPHAFGVLTCETLEQALDRAGLKAGNKGFEAAAAAIEMVSIHRKITEKHA